MRIEFKDQWRVERSREYCNPQGPKFETSSEIYIPIDRSDHEWCN